MQKEFMGDLELQNTKDQTSSEKKEQKNLYQPISSSQQFKEYQNFTSNDDKSDLKQDHSQTMDEQMNEQLPLKFVILKKIQEQKVELIQLFDKKVRYISILVLILHIISYKAYMWTVYTPTDPNWINLHMSTITLVMHIALVCNHSAIIIMWVAKKQKLILALQILFMIRMVTTNMGWDLVNHGGWNLAYASIFTFVIGIFLLTGYQIRCIWKKSKYGKAIVILFCLAILLWFYWRQTIVYEKTKIWGLGFQGMSINNDKGFCKINLESKAYLDGYDSALMMWENWIPEDKQCKKRSESFYIQLIKDKLQIDCQSSQVTVKVLPKFEEWDRSMRRGGKMELSEQVDKHSKLVNVKLNNNHGELDVSQFDSEAFRVYCNGETLLEQRVTSYKKQNNVSLEVQPLPKNINLPFNILVVYIDSLSRRNLQRKLVKTTKLINDKKFWIEHNTTVFQMLKFHSIYTSTTFNLKALFSGVTSLRTVTEEQTKQKRPEFEYDNNRSYSADNLDEQSYGTPDTTFDEENFPTLQKHFRDQKWFTVRLDNSCHDANMKFLGSVSRWDKEFGMNVVCDKRITYTDSIFYGINNIKEKCLDGKRIREPLFTYMREFIKKYDQSDRPWFGWMQFTEAHGPSMNAGKFLDEDVRDFMKHDINYNNTVVVFLSDHGLHMGVWWALKNAVFLKENKMPFLLFFIPDRIKEAHPDWIKGLESNQMNFVSHSDLRATLLDMLYQQTGETNPEPTPAQVARSQRYANSEFDDFKHFRKGWIQGKSMLSSISYDRSCVEVGVPEEYCTCNK